MDKLETLKVIALNDFEERKDIYWVENKDNRLISDWVYDLYCEYDETEIKYINKIADFIVKKENLKLDEYELRNLKTLIYMAGQKFNDEKQNKYNEKMFSDGWVKLTEEIVREAYNKKKKLIISGVIGQEFFKSKIENIYKPYFNEEKNVSMLMKPRARTRGFYLHQFENAFCKII